MELEQRHALRRGARHDTVWLDRAEQDEMGRRDTRQGDIALGGSRLVGSRRFMTRRYNYDRFHTSRSNGLLP
jgi:hypothetical protein